MRGWASKNKDKISHQNKKYKKKNEGKNYKNSILKTSFGITLEDFQDLLEKQNGVCAICNLPEISKHQFGVKNLAVDHNHITGKIRGLLCNKCNLTLGLVNENITILNKMISYIVKGR